MLDVHPIPALRDNFIWKIRCPAAGDRVVVVDPGEAAPVVEQLEAEGSELAAILITHKHWDHVNGVRDLKQRWPEAPVIGPVHPDVPGPDRTVADGDRLQLEALGLDLEVLAVPGHTLEHVAYHGHGAVFTGDTLFSMGCGRMFEGSAEQMMGSLSRLASLADATRLYCGHEYTVANLGFNLTVLPDDPDLERLLVEAEATRRAGRATLPSTIGHERRYNVFLRSGERAVQAACEAHASRAMDDEVDTFATLRRWKDDL